MSADTLTSPSRPTTPPGRRRAVLLGDASLTASCLDLAIAGGLDVVAVATTHDGVRARAGDAGVAVVDSAPRTLPDALAPFEFDVLLSIAYLHVVPADVLARAEVAVNFHDGPLPGYAGLDVTSWALFHGETEHAVTWHLMTERVDAGEIIAVERFPIDHDDTAFSLNARCFEAAIATFPAIVADLVSGTVTTTPQPPGTRRQFRRHDRPIAVVDPYGDLTTTERTVRAVRALALGHQTASSMGAVHLIGPSGHLVVTGAAFEPGGTTEPGSVAVDATDGADVLRVGVPGGELVLTGLELPDGTAVAPVDAPARLGLDAGAVLPPLADGLVDRLAAADAELARNEAFWRPRLGAEPVVPSVLATGDDARSRHELTMPPGTSAHDLVTAIVAWAWRSTDAPVVATVTDAESRRRLAELDPLTVAPFATFSPTPDTTVAELRAEVEAEVAEVSARGPFLADLVGREPSRRGTQVRPAIRVDLDVADPEADPATALSVSVDGERVVLAAPVGATTLDRVARQLAVVLDAVVASTSGPDSGAGADTAVARLPLLGEGDRAIIAAANDTARDHDRTATVDSLIADQTALTPDAAALSSGGVTLTYRELHARARATADRLREAGVGRGDRVGIALDRTADLVIAVLGVHLAGAAYVPLDPTYPADRLRHMVDDSGMEVVIAPADGLPFEPTPSTSLRIVHPLDADACLPAASDRDAVPTHGPADLAYAIYTSGSTGLPKGVLLEHRQVVNFFVAMDDVIGVPAPGDPQPVWLAVTSLSFDISVLELLWTLARGYHVVLQPDQGAKAAKRPGVSSAAPSAVPTRPVSMSLYYFAAGEDTAADGYRLLLDSARFADAHGFEAVWTPERHFHAFGGAYPNPSVVSAALAAATEHVAIRAGSVVAPLHSPVRIAEEWAVVDNLSRGRVGISFAAGWQPNDFVLNPSAYADAKGRLPETIDTIKALWRGETVELPGHDGAPVAVRTLPRPVQADLPTWLTSAGSPSTFEQAGTLGTNLLTHLLGQSVDELAANIERYRAAWRAAGHPGEGQVTLMLHTYLSDDADDARRVAHDPMKGYLGSAAGLLKNMASAFPTFAGSGKSADEAFASLTADELDQLLEMAAGRYLDTSGLFGTVDDAVDMIERCSTIGVDEIACLVDFGIDTDLVLDSLPKLAAVHERLQAVRASATSPAGRTDETVGSVEVDESFAASVARYGVTHLQCTPSLATMLLADPRDRAAVATVGHLMLGGEAMPTALAVELRDLLSGRFTNMYGPTETTIWSLVHEIDEPPTGSVPIGRAIANTTLHVLDARGEPVPVGAWGELHLGGEGVARGYHERPELTAERFVERAGMGRVYATGDVVRLRADGIVEFAGRADHQVKIRGHRIELGEIEAVLDASAEVERSVVIAHARDLGDPWLVAFVVTAGDGTGFDERAARAVVADALPDAYVPSRFVVVADFPLTPNGKIDRNRLAADLDELLARPPSVGADLGSPDAATFDDAERTVAAAWAAELPRPAGRDDNFFEIGGNSLLAVAVYRRLCDATGADLALTDVFRHPTIRTFAAHLAAAIGGAPDGRPTPDSTDAAGSAPVTAADRGALRRQARTRRPG